MAVVRACWRAITRDWAAVLAPGERGAIPIIPADREQARNTLGYLKGLAQHDPLVAPFVAKDRVHGGRSRGSGATGSSSGRAWAHGNQGRSGGTEGVAGVAAVTGRSG